MGKIIAWEVYKLIKKKVFLILVPIIMVGAMLFSVNDYEHFGVLHQAIGQEKELYSRYWAIPEEKLIELEEKSIKEFGQNVSEGFYPIELFQSFSLDEKVSDANLLMIRKDIKETNFRIKEKWNFIVDRADELLIEAENSHDHMNEVKYQAIIRQYSIFPGLYQFPVHGYTEFLSHKYLGIFILLIALTVSFSVFSGEYHSGTDILLWTSKNGRGTMTVGKYSAALLLTIVCSFIMEALCLLVVYFDQGLSGNAPVQALQFFVTCPLHLSVRSYTVLNIFLHLVLAMIASLLFSSISRLSPTDSISALISVLISAALIIIHLFTNVRIHSVLPLMLTKADWFFSSYDVIIIFSLAAYRLIVYIAIWLVFSLLFALISSVIYSKFIRKGY